MLDAKKFVVRYEGAGTFPEGNGGVMKFTLDVTVNAAVTPGLF